MSSTKPLAYFKGDTLDVPVPTSGGFAHYILNASKCAPNDRILYVDLPSGREVTYGEFRDKAIRLSHGLQSRLQSPSGLVACIHSYNSPEFVIVQQACVALGITVTLCNSMYSYYEVNHQLKDSNSSILFIPADKEFLEKCVRAAKDTNIFEICLLSESREMIQGVDMGDIKLTHYLDYLDAASHDSYPDLEIDLLSHRAYIPYSSGTIGLSKGVALTHYNMIFQLHQINSVYHLDEADSIFAVPPLYHAYGLLLPGNQAISAGATVILQRRFDFLSMLANIQKYKVRRLALVPPIILAIAKDARVSDYDISSVVDIASGAAPMPAEQIKVAIGRINNPNGTRFTQGYGMTESGGISTVTRPDTDIKLIEAGSVGRTLPGAELKITSLETGETLPCGEEGEVCMRGKSLMQCYVNRPEETAKTILSDGWLRSGDLGYINPEGYLWITDRLKELIKYKGYQVPPAQLEALLLTHAAVDDCAVIGVPDEDAGELPRAYIKIKKGQQATEEEIKSFVKERVAPFKQLKGGVEFVDQIPKSAAGKILRRMIKDKYLKELKDKSS